MPKASLDRLALAALVVLAALVRLPFWLIALRAPVDGDTGIVGLMALQRSAATSFWGQPYGSPLDSWLAVPFVTLLGPTTLAVRLPYFLLSLALVPLVYGIARRLDPAAGLPAAFLMACPPTYFVLLSALPPPFYPTTLVLLAGLLLGALKLGERLAQGAGAAWGALAWGALAGLALWTHLMSASVLVPCALYLLARARGRRLALLPALLAAVAGSAPSWLAAMRETGVASVVAVADEGAPPWRHALALLPQMHRPLLALLGARSPLTADDPLGQVELGFLGTALLALLYLTTLVAAGFAARQRLDARLLFACLALPILAFPFPLRSGPESVRFLTPAWPALCVLAPWAAVSGGGRARRAWTVVLSLAVWQLLLTSQLLAEWRRPQTVLVPDCRPALALLRERGLARAWASYDTAYCLTYSSGERVIASQPWNERFPGQPLPYLDEVRFSGRAAWVLMPGADFDLPSAERLENWIAGTGGRARRTEVPGGAVVFDEFMAPFSARAHPARGAGAAGDGDLGTRVVEPPAGAVRFDIRPPEALDAVTLLASPQAPGLPAGLLLEISSDGQSFERVARLRPSQRELGWINGHPQAVAGAGLVTIPLRGREVAALRVTPAPPHGPWALAELLLHPHGDSPDRSVEPDLPTPWPQRREALLRAPHPDRVDWLFQLALASKPRKPR